MLPETSCVIEDLLFWFDFLCACGGGLRRRGDFFRHVAELNNPSGLPLARHRLGGARETPPRSGNGTLHVPFPSSQVVKAPPRRGKAFWSAARFVCRMTLYACRSSSHKTRYAIFVGTLKDKKALSRPLHRGGYNKESLKLCCKQGCLAQQDSICTRRALIVLRMTTKLAGDKAS